MKAQSPFRLRDAGRWLAAIATCSCLVLAACRPSTRAEAYVPGLGEIMTLQQMRHIKLWYAGEAGNWALAAYEAKELAEGFDDVVRLHPTLEDAPVAPRDAIPRIVLEPLAEVRAATEQGDEASFERAYDGLTAACNDCHSAMNFAFNVIRRPILNPYGDQLFEPAAP